jgi:predicted dithiol-disulfide oxidoreductase (DUF899 family)
MTLPPVVAREQWLSARKELLGREKALTRLDESLTAERRRLPMVRIQKEYVFHGPAGPAGLPELFDGCRQLIVQHVMFDPSWETTCPSCSESLDELSAGLLAQLRAHNTAFAAVSLAPLAMITADRIGRGWEFPWYSSAGSDFNYDFHATLDETVTPIVYNFQSKAEILEARVANDLVDAGMPVEVPGISCFLRQGGSVFHTYSTYARGLEPVSTARSLLNLTVLGPRPG